MEGREPLQGNRERSREKKSWKGVNRSCRRNCSASLLNLGELPYGWRRVGSQSLESSESAHLSANQVDLAFACKAEDVWGQSLGTSLRRSPMWRSRKQEAKTRDWSSAWNNDVEQTKQEGKIVELACVRKRVVLSCEKLSTKCAEPFYKDSSRDVGKTHITWLDYRNTTVGKLSILQRSGSPRHIAQVTQVTWVRRGLSRGWLAPK